MSEQVPIQVLAFDDIVRCNIEDFLAISTELGEPLIEFGFLIKQAFDKSRDLIEYGLYNTAPTEPAAFFQEQPLCKTIKEIQNFREDNRKNAAFFNHLSTVSESIYALNWISMKPAPTQFIRDLADAGQYYGNRVLKSYKGNSLHISWVNKWTQILKSLELYVKQYFLTGFTWGSAQGGMIQPRPDVPAPPPPPPAPTAKFRPVDPNAIGNGHREALINDLNQGIGITSRLRHVDITAPAPAAPVRPVASHSRPATSSAKTQEVALKPPKFLLEGRKWVVENYKNDYGMSLDNDMTQSLAMFNCQETLLKVKNKINNVLIDKCKKASLVIKDVISCIEIIRCEGFKIQLEGKVPLVNISNSHNIQVFVNDQSKGVEIISSMSSSLNICVVSSDGDYVEYPVPEQIKSIVDGAKIKSSIVETI